MRVPVRVRRGYSTKMRSAGAHADVVHCSSVCECGVWVRMHVCDLNAHTQCGYARCGHACGLQAVSEKGCVERAAACGLLIAHCSRSLRCD